MTTLGIKGQIEEYETTFVVPVLTCTVAGKVVPGLTGPAGETRRTVLTSMFGAILQGKLTLALSGGGRYPSP